MYSMRLLTSQMLCIIANHAVLTKIQDGVVGNLATAAIFGRKFGCYSAMQQQYFLGNLTAI